MRFTVAIDGPAAAGKGTIARAIAAEFGFAHLDTGQLYRAVGAITLQKGRGVIDAALAEKTARNLSPADLSRPDLRSAIAAQAASKVAALPDVRAALVDFQRQFAAQEGGAVLDGRDIGTVVCPQAQVKLFVTATPEIRAHRRWLELGGDEQDVLADVIARDRRDSDRAAAPLAIAPDAVVIDTTAMAIDQAVAAACDVVEAALDKVGGGAGR